MCLHYALQCISICSSANEYVLHVTKCLQLTNALCVGGGGAKERQHFHLPEDVREKNLWRDSAKYIDIKASTSSRKS